MRDEKLPDREANPHCPTCKGYGWYRPSDGWAKTCECRYTPPKLKDVYHPGLLKTPYRKLGK